MADDEEDPLSQHTQVRPPKTPRRVSFDTPTPSAPAKQPAQQPMSIEQLTLQLDLVKKGIDIDQAEKAAAAAFQDEEAVPLKTRDMEGMRLAIEISSRGIDVQRAQTAAVIALRQPETRCG